MWEGAVKINDSPISSGPEARSNICGERLPPPPHFPLHIPLSLSYYLPLSCPIFPSFLFPLSSFPVPTVLIPFLSLPFSPFRCRRRVTTLHNQKERKKLNLTHRQQAVLRVLVLGDARVDPSLPRHRVGRHRLDAAGQPHGVEARLDRRGHGRDRLQARAALPVDGVDRDGVRDPGEQRGDAALDRALRRVAEDRADDDVADVLGVDARALERGLEDGREEVVRGGVLEAAALGLF